MPKPIPALGRYRYVRWRWRLLFALIDAVGGAVVGLLRLLHGSARAPKGTPFTNRPPRSILLVQLDHLGDAILSTGMLHAIRSAYPRAKIDILASPANAALFAACSEVNEVFVCRRTRFAGTAGIAWVRSMLTWGWRLRRNGYDLAIDPRGDFPSAVILALSGAPVRLGWACGGGGFLLTHRAAFVWGRHEVLSRQALLDELGIAPPPGEEAWPPRIPITQRALERIDQRLADCSPLEPAQPLVVLHPGAGTSAKRWPAEHWRELIGRLIVHSNARIALVGTEAEAALVDEILMQHPWPGVMNLCGRLPLDELAALINRADLLIGSDSAPAHLASAVGTPVVAIFSGTNRPQQWRPWGKFVHVVKQPTPCSPCHLQQCPLADHPCLGGLQPSVVFAAAEEFLGRPSQAVADRVSRTSEHLMEEVSS